MKKKTNNCLLITPSDDLFFGKKFHEIFTLVWEAISKTRASCFIRGSKHLETIKAPGLRPRAFICFSVFGTPDETLALVFDILLESHYAVAFATLCDWLKNIAQVCQPMRSKIQTNRTLFARCFRALSKLQVTGRNSDWFIITLYALVVIAWSNNVSIGFSIVIRKVLYGEWYISDGRWYMIYEGVE